MLPDTCSLAYSVLVASDSMLSLPSTDVADSCQTSQACGPVIAKAAVLEHAQQLIHHCRKAALPALGHFAVSLK